MPQRRADTWTYGRHQQEEFMHTGIKQLIGALTLAVALSAQSASAASPKPVPVGSDHYRGTWLEIGRMPMLLTDGCVAG